MEKPSRFAGLFCSTVLILWCMKNIIFALLTLLPVAVFAQETTTLTTTDGGTVEITTTAAPVVANETIPAPSLAETVGVQTPASPELPIAPTEPKKFGWFSRMGSRMGMAFTWNAERKMEKQAAIADRMLAHAQWLTERAASENAPEAIKKAAARAMERATNEQKRVDERVAKVQEKIDAMVEKLKAQGLTPEEVQAKEKELRERMEKTRRDMELNASLRLQRMDAKNLPPEMVEKMKTMKDGIKAKREELREKGKEIREDAKEKREEIRQEMKEGGEAVREQVKQERKELREEVKGERRELRQERKELRDQIREEKKELRDEIRGQEQPAQQ